MIQVLLSISARKVEGDIVRTRINFARHDPDPTESSENEHIIAERICEVVDYVFMSGLNSEDFEELLYRANQYVTEKGKYGISPDSED